MGGPIRAALAIGALLVSTSALAETHIVAPAGGGLAALDVKVDLQRATVQFGAAAIPIPLEPGQLPDARDVVVEAVAIGLGQHAVHVRVPFRGSDASGRAWEAIVVSGRTAPIFGGVTGFADGDPGERTGTAVQIVRGEPTSFVLVGDVREDVRICGQATTLLDPRALYPGVLALKPATVQRLSAQEREGAEALLAVDKGAALDRPLAQLLVARASSAAGSRGSELTDGNVQTVWRELRPGVGQGEFVLMAAPKDVPISRMEIALSPRVGEAGVVPKTFYLVTGQRIFEVSLPENAASKAGEVYEITFPKPIESSCVALVLDAAFTRGLTHPEVSVAELVAYSEFDSPDARLDDVAKRLSGGRAVAAVQVLERAGSAALAAVEGAYDALNPRGRSLAVDVAIAHDRCDEAAPLLTRALCDGAGETQRKAHEKLERCPGAAAVLARRLRDDDTSRGCVAPVLSAIAPAEALEPIADAMEKVQGDDPSTRAALRAALARALDASPRNRLAALLGDTRRSAPTRLEIMRAADERVTDAAPESRATVMDLLKEAPAMRVRYLLLGPLAQLARAGDTMATGRISEAVTHDPSWPVRARAAELAAGLSSVQPGLALATRDAEPRVREAALGALAASPTPAAVAIATTALQHDGWPFVRTRAVELLANAPSGADVDGTLGAALRDGSVPVRAAVVAALGRRRGMSWRSAVRERLADREEAAEVRAAAASALGAMCDSESVDELTAIARALGTPGVDREAQQTALAALSSLAALQPVDLRQRLAPLLASRAPPFVRAVADKALAERSRCR